MGALVRGDRRKINEIRDALGETVEIVMSVMRKDLAIH